MARIERLSFPKGLYAGATPVNVIMSEIIDFFEGGLDRYNRTLRQMQEYSDLQTEASHNHIQWMFPLHEKSFHAQYSPVLSKEDVVYIRNSSKIQEEMLKNLKTFNNFLGLEPFNIEKQKKWCQDRNHNLLRITRVIRSLRLFGLEKEAQNFYQSVLKLAQENKINNTTLEFWENASKDDIMKTLTEKFLNIIKINL